MKLIILIFSSVVECVPLSALKILEDKSNGDDLMDYAISILQAIIYDNMKVSGYCPPVHSRAFSLGLDGFWKMDLGSVGPTNIAFVV